VNALLGMAVVHLKQQKTSDALQDWFEVVDQDPKNKYAARGFAAVRKMSDPERLTVFTESGRIFRLLPGRRSLHPLLLGAGSILILLAAAFLFYPAYASYLPRKAPKAERAELTSLDLNIKEYRSDTSTEEEPVFFMTEGELRKSYAEIIDYFNNYEDNLAQREINRIQESNASEELKQKVSLLEKYIREPGFDTFTRNFSYREVKEKILLYEGCYVIWKGRLSNLAVGSDLIEFDLLVGYESGRVLEGIVPVEVDFAVQLDPELSVEVLGRVKRGPKGLKLEAVSLHQFLEEKGD
jgi:hypothetical protein